MKIINLVMTGYKRVFLNNIMSIDYSPQSKTQIILGQNGSGKSSVLEQLTPVAPNLKKDFNEGGYKKLVIEHNDKLFELSNDHDSNKHSFILDGEELNPGGTVTIQNTLVEYHFGITPQSQQILLGKTQFTMMSPSERKKWMTEISTIDYSYPITVYNKLKQRHRDIIGGIKLLQSNIIRVKKNSLSEELLESLNTDKRNLLGLVDHLLTLISNTTTKDDIDIQITDIDKLNKKLSSITDEYSDISLEELNKRKSDIMLKRDIMDIQIKDLYKKLAEIPSNENVGDKQDLVDKRALVDASINKILSNNAFRDVKDIAFVYNYLTSTYSNIIDLLSTLTEFIGLDISKEHIQEIINLKAKHEDVINMATRKLHKFEERLDHLDHHLKEGKSLECPKCSHIWIPAYGAYEKASCEIAIVKEREQIAKTQLLLDKVNEELASIEKVRHIVTEFIKLLSHNEDTKLLLRYIRDNKSFSADAHGNLFSQYEFINSEIGNLYQVVKLREELADIDTKLVIIENNEKLKSAIKEENREKINTAIEHCRKILVEHNEAINNLDIGIRNKTNIVNGLTDLKSKIRNVYQTRRKLLVAKQDELIKGAIGELRLMILDVENQLSQHVEFETMLKSYQTELDALNVKEKLLKLVVKELSPSEGLIAKSISSFLNCFIQDMNNIISQVWGYDMEILGCDLGEDDLDYKFKVLVNNTEVIEDISKTSSSMQEMINLVFKIMFSKYKGFINYPLILDEFGRTFDANHRITAYEALERTISEDFSQIYMVSHFESMYGRFGNADVSVLGTTGVDLNTVTSYNEVMKLS